MERNLNTLSYYLAVNLPNQNGKLRFLGPVNLMKPRELKRAACKVDATRFLRRSNR